MAKLNDHYYIGDLAKLHEDAILKSLKMDNVYPDVYFVTLASNPAEQLDIIESLNYFSPFNPIRMEIVGIAFGKNEALKLVKKIAEEVYRDHRASDIREYFGAGK